MWYALTKGEGLIASAKGRRGVYGQLFLEQQPRRIKNGVYEIKQSNAFRSWTIKFYKGKALAIADGWEWAFIKKSRNE